MSSQEEIELKILKNTGKVISQKTLAEDIGYSVGKVNFVLKGLLSKGYIKAEKFINSDKKLQYKYILTQEGFKEKVIITERFIKRKKEEYDELQADLEKYKEENIYTNTTSEGRI
ncbi:MarR family EPS-associated transcriptional regulator [Poseidonibacter ostreae]|uniref:MarR family EPS-associated transcriptional regulator n=1 Tax=Poseidonibacter ostreae TaxID=2654171 RepID=A0A6L4WRK6_9BACT|nr:MarR family EPS-associated transcriptional regulator [Poseidonibacter ostreae]KAB7887425.1 MarR family EPS-associated transcriptional regulator [Poseidonibacter ostreae]